MFANNPCLLPSTGNSLFFIIAIFFSVITGVLLVSAVRTSSGRLSVVLAPLLFAGGLAFAPQTSQCVDVGSMPTEVPTMSVASSTTVENTSTTVVTPVSVVASTTVVPTTTVAPTTTAIAETTTTTAIARTCAQGGACALGDTGPGGGKVFYIAPTVFTETGATCSSSCKYLEAAPDNWFGGTDPMRSWSHFDYRTTEIFAGAAGVGTGFQNTEAINSKIQNTTDNSAAKLARSYVGGGLTDWFLPSLDELIQMHSQQARVGNFGTNDGYWSSTESGTNGASYVRFDISDIDNVVKTAVMYVRPVRAFGAS